MRDKAERRDERTLKKQRTWLNDETRDAIKKWSKKKSSKEAVKTNDFGKDSFTGNV